MSNPTPEQMNCGRCLYGPPALCTCGTCPADEDDDPCVHEEYEIDILTGRASCDSCGHVWNATEAQMKHHEEMAARCYECEVNYADTPSKLCPGCQAYREHQS